MSCWITGDIHGNPRRFFADSFYEQKEMKSQEDNFIIVCGDFGLIWNKDSESDEEEYYLDLLEEKPFYTLFVDGNHENFDKLYQYPVKEWHGGMVHEIRPHVLHLMRGQVFTIEGKKFFTFGGASSHDIQDGILDANDYQSYDKFNKAWNQWNREGKMFRIKGLSWWPQELPTEEEMDVGRRNLEKHNNKVDFIITHSPSASIIALLGHGLYKQDRLTQYLEEVKCNTEYTKMFSGHMHINKAINDKDICLYEQIIRII